MTVGWEEILNKTVEELTIKEKIVFLVSTKYGTLQFT